MGSSAVVVGGIGAVALAAVLLFSRRASAAAVPNPVAPSPAPTPGQPPIPTDGSRPPVVFPPVPLPPPPPQSPVPGTPQPVPVPVPRGTPRPSPSPQPERPQPEPSGPQPIIGYPFLPGAESYNAEQVCQHGYLSHPNGRHKGRNQSLEDWYTDVAYWETYPTAPRTISRSSAHRGFAAQWLRIREHVRACMSVPQAASAQQRVTKRSAPSVQVTKRGPSPKGSASRRRTSTSSDAPARVRRSDPASTPRRRARQAQIGAPFVEGDERGNAAHACARRELSHPNGQRKKEGQPLVDWLTDVAYWETYPHAPIRLTRAPTHRAYVQLWSSIRRRVERCMQKAGARSVLRSSKASKLPRQAKVRRSPEPIPNAQPTRTGAGAEGRNAAIVLVAKPQEARHQGRVVRRRATQKDVDWLTNVAFWATYPEAPIKLNLKRREDQQLAKAWTRIKGFVGRGLKLQPQLEAPPHLDFISEDVQKSRMAIENWHRWALALSFKSARLRTAEQLRRSYQQAARWVSRDSEGTNFRTRYLGKVVGGQTVGMDGLLGEVAQWFSQGGAPRAQDFATKWPEETLSKAFFSTNGIWVRR